MLRAARQTQDVRPRLRLALIAAISLCHIPLPSQAPAVAKDAAGVSDFTVAQLQQIYDSLPPADRELIDTWSTEDRLAYLKAKAILRITEAGADGRTQQPVTTPSAPTKAPYRLDPVLKEAWLAYIDPDRPRDEVIALFNKYLDRDPNSVFLAEIYFRIGALYCIHRREKLNDPYMPKVASAYYEKAHKLCGGKFSYEHTTAWGSLIGWPWAAFQTRKQFYAWLVKLSKEITPDDIYPIRPIEQTLDGRYPELTLEDKLRVMKGLEHNISAFLDTAGKNILMRTANNYNDLVDLAVSFPDTELGKHAELGLRKLDAALLHDLDSRRALSRAAHKINGSTDGVGPVPDSNTPQTTQDVVASPKGRSYPISLADYPPLPLVLGLLAFPGLCLLLWRVRWRRP